MKKNAIIIALATTAMISLAFIVGHNYSSRNAKKTYTISNETAQRYKAAWRQQEEAAGKKRGEYVEAYNVDATEMQEIMQALTSISNGDISKMSVRFYLGINDAGKQTLVIVTVDNKGNDIAYYKDAQGNLQSAIFDFTTPSPPFNPAEDL